MAIKRLTALADIFRDTNTANTILGLGGNDTIYGNGGNDIIDGGTGIDTMRGGLGNDTYVVDRATDKAIESAGQGTDIVKSKVTFILGGNVEKLTLTGAAAINGTGNTLANTITGNGAANILNGGAGADILIGGGGNDTYVIDNAGDTVSDTSGIDIVRSSITYTVGGAIENLTLSGVGNINGTGNALDNRITGNAGNNNLQGGLGADILIGGVGRDFLDGGDGVDHFVFTTASDSPYSNNFFFDWDAIFGFQPGEKIDLSALHVLAANVKIIQQVGAFDITVDVDNDTVPDLGIRLINSSFTITMGEFIL